MTQTVPKSAKATVGAIAVMIILAFCFTNTSRPNDDVTQQGAADGVAVGREMLVTVNGFGCASTDSLERLRELAGDRLAALRFVALPSSGCRQLDSATSVLVEDVASNKVKVRPIGDPRSIWTYRYIFTHR